jgi:hypothetical protein
MAQFHGTVFGGFSALLQFSHGLGTASINIGPVLAQKLKFRHLQFFLVEIVRSVPLLYKSDLFYENARSYYEYRIQNRSNFPDFPKFH